MVRGESVSTHGWLRRLGGMWFLATVLAAVCAGSVVQTPASPPVKADKTAREPLVRWKGNSYAGKAIAEAIGESAAASVVPWSPWAQAHGYALDLDPDLRRLFVHPAQRSSSAELAIVSRVIALVDKLAPPTATKAPAVVAIFVLAGPADFATLLDDVGARFPVLENWAQGEKGQAGFVLDEPFAAACLSNSPDQKEWNPKNELANRTAQLVLVERFGRLPNWLMQGLAWHAEISVCGSIFCFPFRSGFVAKQEHRSWPEQLKALLAPASPGVAGRTLTIDDLAGWKRGSYENDRALIAWGAASFLAKQRAKALPLILEDLRAIRAKESKLTKPDGSWQIKPDYEVPPERQLEILKARAGDDFLKTLKRFCEGG